MAGKRRGDTRSNTVRASVHQVGISNLLLSFERRVHRAPGFFLRFWRFSFEVERVPPVGPRGPIVPNFVSRAPFNALCRRDSSILASPMGQILFPPLLTQIRQVIRAFFYYPRRGGEGVRCPKVEAGRRIARRDPDTLSIVVKR